MTPESTIPSLDEIVGAVQDDVRREHGPGVDVSRIGDPLEGGFDNTLVRVELAGADRPPTWPTFAVARVLGRSGTQAKAAREQAVQEYCRVRGFPAARVLLRGTVGDYPYLLIDYVDAPPAVAHIIKPWRIPRTMKTLAVLQTKLHEVATDAWPSDGPVRTVDRWLEDMRTAAIELADTSFDEPLAWLEANRGRGENDDLRVCHYDFTPLNVLLPWKGEPTVIDWDGAALGDPCSDLGFSLEFLALVPAALSPSEARIARPLMSMAQRVYLRTYRGRVPVDRARLRFWRAVYAVLARLWMCGATVGDISNRESHERGDAFPPTLIDAAASRFQRLTAS